MAYAMAAKGAVTAAKWLPKLLAWLFGADYLSGAVGGPTNGSMLGGDVEGAEPKRNASQEVELRKVAATQQRDGLFQKMQSGLGIDPEVLLTLGSLVQSGMYDRELTPPLDPENSLASYVAKRMGMTQEQLEAKTRPRLPFDTLKG